MDTPESIIPDSEIEAVHGYANFGGMGKRQVVNEAVLKAAFGYSSGGTATAILRDHALIRVRRDSHAPSKLTVKGLKYLRAVYGPHFDQIKKLGMV